MQPFSATVANYDALVDAFRARKAELGLTDDTLEGLAGLTRGHVSKLLGPGRVKAFGPMSFEIMLAALGVKLLMVEDPEAVAALEKRWTRRDRPVSLLSNPRTRRATWLFDKRKARKLAKMRWSKVTPSSRSKFARMMNRKRWHKVRTATAHPDA